MQGGAITADSRGGGSIWYNPAGLGHIEGTRLDVNVNGYALRIGGTADFSPTDPSAEVTKLSRLDLTVVPTALTLTRRFGDVGVGLGVFVPSQSTTILRTRVDSTQAMNSTSVDFGFDSTTRVQEYHLGPAVGWSPIQDLSLGASLLVNYRTLVEDTNFVVRAEEEGQEVGLVSHSTLDSQRFGLALALGGQWSVAPDWHLGFVVRTPALRLGEVVQQVETSLVASDPGTMSETIEFREALAINTSIWSPARLHAGISHDFANVHAALDANFQLPFQSEDLGLDFRPTWNVRAGARTPISPRLSVGAGIFTDRSPDATPDEFQESRLDFYGATIALDIGTTYGIHAKNDVPFERAKTLFFGTTIAFSYALGVGSIVNAQLGPAPGGGITFDNVPDDVIAHEFTLHFGSTVME